MTKVRLTELQQIFLKCFPYQRLDGELIPLNGQAIRDYRLDTRQPRALVEKGLIRERGSYYSWELTDKGEEVLREIDPEWAKATDSKSSELRSLKNR